MRLWTLLLVTWPLVWAVEPVWSTLILSLKPVWRSSVWLFQWIFDDLLGLLSYRHQSFADAGIENSVRTVIGTFLESWRDLSRQNTDPRVPFQYNVWGDLHLPVIVRPAWTYLVMPVCIVTWVLGMIIFLVYLICPSWFHRSAYRIQRAYALMWRWILGVQLTREEQQFYHRLLSVVDRDVDPTDCEEVRPVEGGPPAVFVPRRLSNTMRYWVSMAKAAQAKFDCTITDPAQRAIVRRWIYSEAIAKSVRQAHIAEHIDLVVELAFTPTKAQRLAVRARQSDAWKDAADHRIPPDPALH